MLNLYRMNENTRDRLRKRKEKRFRFSIYSESLFNVNQLERDQTAAAMHQI